VNDRRRKTYFVKDVMGPYSDIIYNLNDGVRNVGFAMAGKLGAEYIYSFDDDVEPIGDTLQSHYDALQRHIPVTWLSTTGDDFMRGFPYNRRGEVETVVSHGIWEGVPDLDAPTQLLHPDTIPDFYRGPIPKGILYPHCAMNFAFKRKALPFVYQAPMGHRIGLDRFADIWGGIEMKKDLDQLGLGVVSGYASVFHTRASNVFTNLKKEAAGLEMNEQYGEGAYFDLFYEQRERWKEYIFSIL
jgi:reversibly glycosylated polypeptide/UDP-arabinopyranose mutase